MATNNNSNSNQGVNEVEKTATDEDLRDRITYEIELRPGDNRLVIRVRRDYVFSV